MIQNTNFTKQIYSTVMLMLDLDNSPKHLTLLNIYLKLALLNVKLTTTISKITDIFN